MQHLVQKPKVRLIIQRRQTVWWALSIFLPFSVNSQNLSDLQITLLLMRPKLQTICPSRRRETCACLPACLPGQPVTEKRYFEQLAVSKPFWRNLQIAKCMFKKLWRSIDDRRTRTKCLPLFCLLLFSPRGSPSIQCCMPEDSLKLSFKFWHNQTTCLFLLLR